MKKNVFVVICFFTVLTWSVSYAQETQETPGDVVAQEESAPDLFADYECFETTNFKVYYTSNSAELRPFPDETGEIFEQFMGILDRTFGKTILVAENKKKRDLEKKNKAKEKPESGDTPPSSVAEKQKVNFLLLDDRKSLSAKLKEHNSTVKLNMCDGCFDPQTKTIYLARADNIYQTRSAMFFQLVSYYVAEYFPGTQDDYPQWFSDSLAMAFRDHLWNGKRLTVGGWPLIQTQDMDQLAIETLETFQRFIINEKSLQVPEEVEPEKTTAKKSRRSKNQAQQGTEVNDDLLDRFFSEHFSQTHESVISQRAFCWALGKYLLSERSDVIKKLLTDMVFPATEDFAGEQNIFQTSWQKAFEKQPLIVEQIGYWIAEHHSPWTVVFNEWQFTGEEFLCRTSDAALLLYEGGNIIPPFKVFLHDEKGIPGLVFNFLDKDNYDSIRLHETGKVSHARKINGNWGSPEILFTFMPPKKNQVFSNEESTFSVRPKGDMTEISINNICVFSDYIEPGLPFGMLLEGYKTEASFLPRR